MRIRPLRAAVAALALAATAACSLNANPTTSAKPGSLAAGVSLKGATFTVGSKEFTEQLVLCHITSLALQSAGATVREKCGLSGSDTTRTALTSGSIDMYWEYTGTAWINYLKHTDPIPDAARQYQAVAQQDLAANHVRWLDASPANNTYAIAVKASTARELGVSTLSDYARLTHTDPAKASLCAASEFLGRNDGLPGLERAYGFTVTPANLAEGAIYNAVANNNPCNFGEADTTDGRISGLGLTVLTDDRNFFPIYNPALTLREDVYQAHPDLAKIANPIAAALTTDVLQQLNAAVDIKGQDPAQVAQTWLQDKGFVGR
ncbi:glycine betaine ABC transporter substrate-binding protein [Gandjariella thermophila]|uniref:Glycine/betaine ABC transporter substrate-binding protein n=1 Tax=Gandjariella thermophila TaxID=1931992 RepID=A0A4D4J9J4_9PSEU|nr:glycine betaine ABC transporter substrate-binding protein [Gandjariella thermophila]GDY31670.1 glycine/betaine ABC transporter substrate-binding protein [Gandjariella thermophila]